MLLVALLLDLQRDARTRAGRGWDSRKAVIAARWSAVAIGAGHIPRCLGGRTGGRRNLSFEPVQEGASLAYIERRERSGLGARNFPWVTVKPGEPRSRALARMAGSGPCANGSPTQRPSTIPSGIRAERKGKGEGGCERTFGRDPETNFMSYDIASRFQQALDPSALADIAASLHAIGAAITDCRNAGIATESDPAVILLCRHLSAICADRGDDGSLRQICMQRIGELRSKPALRTLALRGVAYDEPAKRLFHSEGRASLARLAGALALDSGTFEIRSNKAGPAVSGEVTLHAEILWVQLSLGPFGPGREICFRRVQGRGDHNGERNHWASVSELLAPDNFAERIRRDLRLPCATPAEPHLVA